MASIKKQPKRIGIDARFYGPAGKGLGRYTKEVVDNILKIDKVNKYVIFLGQDNFAEFQTNNPRVKKVLVKAKWYTLAEQIIMPWLIWRQRIDLMHFPHFNVPLLCPAKFVVTIHDLILVKHPTQRATTLGPIFYRLKYAGYKLVIKSAVKKAQKVLAVSEFTRNDIIEQFNVNPDKVIVTHEGISVNLSERMAKDDGKTLLRYNIHKPYCLYVGNAYPHKNLEGLIKVFRKISQKNGNISLVLVGKDDYFYLRVKEFAKELAGNVIFPGYIPDFDLATVYRQAMAYIFPSFYEGFGLPPLEAMAQGCPVASSNKSSLPEILGKAALYFNPDDEIDMYHKIMLIINDANLRNELVRKGYQQVKKYDWQKCAEQTLAVYSGV